MGGRRPTLPPAELAAILKADNFRDNEFLHALQRTEPVYQTLFELVDVCRKQTRLRSFEDEPRPPQTLAELEPVLLKIYSGKATANEAGQILLGLQTSPNFYHLLLVKLEALTPHVAWEEAKTLEGITMKSSDEVLTIVRTAMTRDEKLESVGEKAWRKLGEIAAETAHAGAHAWEVVTHTRAIAVGLPLLLIAILTVFQISDLGKETIPVPLPGGGLRGSEVMNESDKEYNQFRDTFLVAMSDYVIGDYANTLKKFESNESKAKLLYLKRENGNYAALLRDYYFYRGVSHLLLSQPKSFFSRQPRRHAEAAVSWLMRADTLAQADTTGSRYRETYYLGMAYGNNKQKQQAVAELQKIPHSNPYYGDSDEKIKTWSNP